MFYIYYIICRIKVQPHLDAISESDLCERIAPIEYQMQPIFLNVTEQNRIRFKIVRSPVRSNHVKTEIDNNTSLVNKLNVSYFDCV